MLFCVGCSASATADGFAQRVPPQEGGADRLPERVEQEAVPDAPPQRGAPQRDAEPSDDPFERIGGVVEASIAQARDAELEQLQALERQLHDDDPAVRDRALYTILRSEDARMAPAMVAALGYTEARMRREAILALMRVRADGVEQAVGALIETDPDPRVRHAAAEYGRQLGYVASEGQIDRLLAEPDFGSQSMAMHLCQSLPEHRVAQVMSKFLDHESHHLRKRAVIGLMRCDAAFVAPYAVQIIEMAGDTDGWVRGEVRRSERDLAAMLTAAQLRPLAEHESEEVRETAERIQGHIDRRRQ